MKEGSWGERGSPLGEEVACGAGEVPRVDTHAVFLAPAGRMGGHVQLEVHAIAAFLTGAAPTAVGADVY